MRINKGWKLVAALAWAGLGASARDAAAAVKKVAFVLSSSEARYTETQGVILDIVKKSGLKIETSTLVLDKDKKKAFTAIAALATGPNDVYVTLGSVASGMAAQIIKEKPVVFGHVFNPIDSGLIKDWTASGTNFTGGSNFVSLSGFMTRLNDEIPLKKVAILYTPNEKQSEQHLTEYMKAAAVLKTDVKVIIIKDEKDVAGLAGQLKGLDALFLTGGTPIGGNLKAIMEAAIRTRILTATHTDSFLSADPGVLLGVSCSATEVGKISAEALLKVLAGIKPNDIPSRSPAPEGVMNAKTAKAQGFVASDKLKSWMTKVIN